MAPSTSWWPHVIGRLLATSVSHAKVPSPFGNKTAKSVAVVAAFPNLEMVACMRCSCLVLDEIGSWGTSQGSH